MLQPLERAMFQLGSHSLKAEHDRAAIYIVAKPVY
jgi:hypothetical protein